MKKKKQKRKEKENNFVDYLERNNKRKGIYGNYKVLKFGKHLTKKK